MWVTKMAPNKISAKHSKRKFRDTEKEIMKTPQRGTDEQNSINFNPL